MKTLPSLLFLLITSFTFSQDGKIIGSSDILDSTYFFEYVLNEYKLTEKYYVLERTETGEVLNAIQFEYDSVQDIWFNHYSDTITYYENQNRSESIRKFWEIDNGEWIDCEYSKWNEDGKIEDTYIITRIYGIPAATYGARQINTYDENGNLIKIIEKNCGDDLVWNIIQTKDYEYDDYNRLVTYVFDSITKWEYSYNDIDQNDEIFISLININQEWDTTWHRVLTYSNDSLIEDLAYKYMTNMEFARDTFRYDISQKITLRYYELWDTIDNNWYTSVILKHQYNADDQIIEYANISRFGGEWEFVRYLYNYDLYGNLIEYKRQSGDSTIVLNEWRYNYTYTGNNSLLMEEYQVYDIDNEIWLNKLKQNNYWSDFTNVSSIANQNSRFEVFPNPCNGTVYLRSNYSTPYELSIYELTGKFILFEIIKSGSKMLNLKNGELILFLAKEKIFFLE